jgi:hypothetical protein
MQGDRHILGKEADDLHVPAVVAARNEIVLRLHEVERDNLRLQPNDGGRKRGLDEHVIDGHVAQDLRDEAERDAACGLGAWLLAGELFLDIRKRGDELATACGRAFLEAARLQRCEPGRIAAPVGDRFSEPVAIAGAIE